MYEFKRFYIDGAWVTPPGRRELAVINPATEQQVGTIMLGTADDVDVAVKAARTAFETYSQTTREERVALLEHPEVDDVDGDQRLQRRGGIVADQQHLAHVGHVEQAGLRAGVLVLGHHAGGVLDRHVVAGEGHHLGAEFDMQRVQRGLVQRGRGRGIQGLIGGHVSLRGHSS